MRGVYNFFGQLGVLIMTLVSGFLYDSYGPSSPFLVIGCLDFALALVTMTFCLLGHINPNRKEAE